MESSFRPLASVEQRFLRRKTRELESRLARASKALIPGVAVLGDLMDSDPCRLERTWLTVTVFWVAVGSGILLWARRDFRKDLSDILRGYESARYRNEAEVFEIQAKSFVEFEEVEDEGAYYAFEIGADRIVFVTGQEFYPGPKYSVSRLRAGLHPQRAGRPC